MKATQFFLGFGPRLWSFRRGETEYGVRALPLGAFVRIIGMNNMDEVPPADEARTYRQQSYPRRMLVISAGSIMHMLIAVVPAVHRVRRSAASWSSGRAPRSPSQAERPGRRGRPADGRHRRSASTARPSTAPRSSASAVRSHEPGDVVAGRRRARRRGADDRRSGSARTPTRPSPTFGTALLGVSSRTASDWDEMSLGEAADVQRHRPVPDGVGVDEGRRQGAQPGQHLSSHLDRRRTTTSTTRPTTRRRHHPGQRRRSARPRA